jgi:hypothetical protein
LPARPLPPFTWERGWTEGHPIGATMTKPFDATTRNLVEMSPAEWSDFLGTPVAHPSRVRLIDANLSTVTADADRVIRLEDPIPWLRLIEMQAGRDIHLVIRLHLYSTLLYSRHRLPVRTTLVLLRKAADGPDLTGYQELRYPDGEIYDWFRYDVLRVWEQPVERVLAAGLAVLPLAPVAKVEREKVPEILVAISDRLKRETNPDQAATLWNATRILMGLRYSDEETAEMIQGVFHMLYGIRGIEESSVYQGILKKGRADHARTILTRHGTKKFGPPDEQAQARIAAIADTDRLDELVDLVLDVASWDELLGPPSQ